MHEKQQRKRRKIQKRNAEIANHIFYIKFTKKGETLFFSFCPRRFEILDWGSFILNEKVTVKEVKDRTALAPIGSLKIEISFYIFHVSRSWNNILGALINNVIISKDLRFTTSVYSSLVKKKTEHETVLRLLFLHGIFLLLIDIINNVG